MIPYRGRDGRRGKTLKLTRNIERLYKESKCRECSVVVTRMDFAKILGKFTKVKIQYESSPTLKTQKTPQSTKTKPQGVNTRLRNNENGMVLFHRSTYNPHPAKSVINSSTPKNTTKVASPTTRQASTNVLKEVNVIKNNLVQGKSSNYKNIHTNGKQYAIVFNVPTSKQNHNNNLISEISLSDLIPKVSADILPSHEWCIDYFPKNDEPKNDKVYDRIAAELEDLMYNEKSDIKLTKTESTENKAEDFPSIMDILNDNNTPESSTVAKDQNSSLELKDNIESNDVEAILLGKADSSKTETPMDVDSMDVNKLIADVVQFSTNSEAVNSQPAEKDLQNSIDIDNPHSPSILDEALQKGIEEHLPNPNRVNDKNITNNQNSEEIRTKDATQLNFNSSSMKLVDVTHVIFKKVSNGKCEKSVTCPKNLKYSIEIQEKSVEFLGAPKHISSIEDLQVLLQIVDETDLNSLYILY